MKRNAIAVAAALALLSVAGTALACGGNPMPQTRRATPDLGSTMKATFLAAHPGASSVRVTRAHYGTVMGDWFAVVTFTVDGHRQKPTIFARHHRDGHTGPWYLARQTRGAVCGRYVPVPLIRLWHLDRVHHTDCYVEPGANV